MDGLVALLPIPAYGAAIATVALVADRLLSGDEAGLAALFRIESDPHGPRGVHEDEPVRWNVERLRRPTRGQAQSAAAIPTGAAGGLEGTCVP